MNNYPLRNSKADRLGKASADMAVKDVPASDMTGKGVSVAAMSGGAASDFAKMDSSVVNPFIMNAAMVKD